MRVVSDSEARPAAAGLAGVRALADALLSTHDAPVLTIWRSQRALLVTRQDTHLAGFAEVSGRMADDGWPVVLRTSGGSACPVSPGTLQIAKIEPALAGATMNANYDALAALIESALQCFGVAARTGFVAGAYCSGNDDVAIDGRKIAGMAQHWFRNRAGIRCVMTAASVNVEETPDALADAVNAFYASVGNAMRCRASALTSLRLCERDSAAVRDLVPSVISQLAAVADSLPGNLAHLAARADVSPAQV